MSTLVPHRHHHAGEEHHFRGFPDFGDVRDNTTALSIALYAMEYGERRWGCDVLMSLHDHICTTHEVQSVQRVLPQVETVLGACAGIAALSAALQSPPE
jgi:hypothetical protein